MQGKTNQKRLRMLAERQTGGARGHGTGVRFRGPEPRPRGWQEAFYGAPEHWRWEVRRS